VPITNARITAIHMRPIIAFLFPPERQTRLENSGSAQALNCVPLEQRESLGISGRARVSPLSATALAVLNGALDSVPERRPPMTRSSLGG
jgi:hypothetical protein